MIQNGGQLIGIIPIVKFRATDNGNPIPHKLAVEITVSISGAIRRDKQIRVYEIWRVRRHKLLAIAVAMKLSLEECQQLLRLARVNELYAKNKRDSIIIFGLMKQLDIKELNDLLYDMEEFVLQ